MGEKDGWKSWCSWIKTTCKDAQRVRKGERKDEGIREGSSALPPHVYLLSREATRRDHCISAVSGGKLHFLKCKETGKEK